MLGVRFYQEFNSKADKRRDEGNGNVVAVFEGQGYWSGGIYCESAVGSVFSYADSPVASTGVARDVLSSQCKRIGEAQARQIHPQLFAYLDAPV